MNEPEKKTDTVPLSREVAGKIADALGLPMETTKLEIVLDWQARKFFCRFDFYVTDQQGERIAQALK